MAKVEIIVVGAAGRVGRELVGLLTKNKSASLYIGVDYKGRADVTDIARVRPIKHTVVVDFSTPATFRTSLNWCVKTRTPFVSGTTGLTAKDFSALKRAGKKTPVLWAANMSEGVNVFLNLIEAVGPRFSGYDLQLEEIHHIHKKDAPSGTAKLLRDRVERVSGKKMPPPVSIRGGGVFGVHKLMMMNENEVITIEHSALNRRVFAAGALQAATWLVGKRPGVYSMQDVLREKR
jgi:4-hydroxy-tetrahydrodipicolinate reductase